MTKKTLMETLESKDMVSFKNDVYLPFMANAIQEVTENMRKDLAESVVFEEDLSDLDNPEDEKNVQ